MQRPLEEYPILNTAINECAIILIEATQKSGYQNPDINCTLNVDDGRIYVLKFERVDAD